MPFIDIAFQAEVSRYEDAEFEECARRNCGEFADTRDQAIRELRRLIIECASRICGEFADTRDQAIRELRRVIMETFQIAQAVEMCRIFGEFCDTNDQAISHRGECNPRRLDDAYLLRFLRCRRFIPALAHKLMVRYENFRRKNAYLYECNAFGLQKVKNVYGGTMPDSPVNGRITLMRFGRWDPEAVSVEDVVRCALLMDEIAALQPRLQILGVTIIVDLAGLSLRHVSKLTPTIASHIVSLMGVSFPLLNHGLHVVNYSWILNTFFYVFKQFIPSAAWDRIHFHGYDMSSLHKHIDPKYLPPEYGGYSKYVISTEEWIAKIDKYKDDFLVKELRELGFTVEDCTENFSDCLC